MKTISLFVLEKTLIAGLLLVFMTSAVLADEQSDKRKSDANKAVDYLFGLNSASMPEDIMLDKFKEEFNQKAEEFQKYKARLLEKKSNITNAMTLYGCILFLPGQKKNRTCGSC